MVPFLTFEGSRTSTLPGLSLLPLASGVSGISIPPWILTDSENPSDLSMFPMILIDNGEIWSESKPSACQGL